MKLFALTEAIGLFGCLVHELLKESSFFSFIYKDDNKVIKFVGIFFFPQRLYKERLAVKASLRQSP